MNVYFISGIFANCHVFDQLELPENFSKKYIEWLIPDIDDTMEEYARKMAASIDIAQPFILVGYSFGGMIVQEMNKFLSPVKNIIIASVKGQSEYPPLLRLGRRINFAEHFPWWSLSDSQKVKEMIARLYRLQNVDTLEYVTHTNPVYIKWSVSQILNWDYSDVCPNLYHIHGTRDITFPHKYIKNTILINGGDHLMVIKRPRKVSQALAEILNN